MPEAVTVPRPDTSDMERAHGVMRDALSTAPQLLGAIRADDAAQAARVAMYYETILLFIHIHHEGEDELLWPILRRRCPNDVAAVEHVVGQHERLLVDLAAAESLLSSWRADPALDQAAALAAGLAVLGANLIAHLEDEERTILPLVAQHLTVEEWEELPAHGSRQWRERAPRLRWLVMGLLREQQSDEIRAKVEAGMPQAVRDYWTTEGEPRYREFIAELRAR